MLGYLAVGSQLCPQQQAHAFGALFAKLVREDGYGENIINGHATSPGSIAFFDCETDRRCFLDLTYCKIIKLMVSAFVIRCFLDLTYSHCKDQLDLI